MGIYRVRITLTVLGAVRLLVARMRPYMSLDKDVLKGKEKE